MSLCLGPGLGTCRSGTISPRSIPPLSPRFFSPLSSFIAHCRDPDHRSLSSQLRPSSDAPVSVSGTRNVPPWHPPCMSTPCVPVHSVVPSGSSAALSRDHEPLSLPPPQAPLVAVHLPNPGTWRILRHDAPSGPLSPSLPPRQCLLPRALHRIFGLLTSSSHSSEPRSAVRLSRCPRLHLGT